MRRARLIGLALTLLAVLVLAGSLILGLRADAPDDRTSGSDRPTLPEGGPRVRVEVLNAAGISGLARAGTEHLRAAGFDVVFYGNATGFDGDSTLVFDRVGSPDPARRVAEALGVREPVAQIDTALYVDVTVVLGRDWAVRTGRAPAPEL